jgi:hypothetical protein
MIPSGVLQNSTIDNLPDRSVYSDGSKHKTHKRPWTQ